MTFQETQCKLFFIFNHSLTLVEQDRRKTELIVSGVASFRMDHEGGNIYTG